jgi:hypothetical protein
MHRHATRHDVMQHKNQYVMRCIELQEQRAYQRRRSEIEWMVGCIGQKASDSLLALRIGQCAAVDERHGHVEVVRNRQHRIAVMLAKQ